MDLLYLEVKAVVLKKEFVLILPSTPTRHIDRLSIVLSKSKWYFFIWHKNRRTLKLKKNMGRRTLRTILFEICFEILLSCPKIFNKNFSTWCFVFLLQNSVTQFSKNIKWKKYIYYCRAYGSGLYLNHNVQRFFKQINFAK